jgi:mono/diheme cytochrome c family protein
MKRMRKLVCSVIALVAVGAAFAIAYGWQPAIAAQAEAATPASADARLVARGARLAEIGDCMYCHTASHGKPFAGGLPINTPFGAIYSTNITPDPQTGIGLWSLAAFTRALRDGVSRDGHLLYPAFPYPHFTKMSDEDIAALYAYLQTRTPVEAPAHRNALRFPLNFRPLLAGWNLLFLTRGPLPPPAGPHSELWLRGRYLVEGPGHCASCHTPMNALGAEKSSSPFAGGQIDGWDAPPLNALTRAPRPWTEAQLVAYLRTGIANEHGAAAGPMLPVTQHLANVPQSDIEAMANYLMSLQPPASAQPAMPATSASASSAASSANATQLQAGAAVFAASCASCHADGAPMHDIGDRPLLGLSTSLTADSPRNAIQWILHGNPWNGSASAQFMPPFADALDDQQIADVLAYVRVQEAQRLAWPDVAARVAAIRKENPQP